MKIQIASDIHTEFHHDYGLDFARTLSDYKHDVLILAGDIGTLATLEYCLPIFRQHVKNVIYVTGNHEYYGHSFDEVHEFLQRLTEKYDNFHWLNNQILELGGQRFLGTTLWYPRNSDTFNLRHKISDASYIVNWERVFDEEILARSFLEENLRENDIVVTHYLPTEQSISDRYKGNEINCYFMNPMDELMIERRPQLWIHGHTHDSKDFLHNPSNTRIVCNPFGYAGHALNVDYEDVKTIVI